MEGEGEAVSFREHLHSAWQELPFQWPCLLQELCRVCFRTNTGAAQHSIDADIKLSLLQVSSAVSVFKMA